MSEIDDLVTIVRAAFFPFEPDRVIASIDQGPTLDRKLYIDVYFGERRFNLILKIDDVMLRSVSYPEQAQEFLFTQIYELYRNRPSLPVDDHICLGEE